MFGNTYWRCQVLTSSFDDWAGGILLFLFALGWFDLGQGPQYTWWGLMHYLGNL